jgi:hypothetical protein
MRSDPKNNQVLKEYMELIQKWKTIWIWK